MRHWQLVLRWTITLGALGYVASHVDWRQLGGHIARAHPGWVALSSLLSIGVILLMGLRWKCVLRACDLRVPVGSTTSVTFIGQFFNSFLPGSTGGDMVKAWYATRWAPERKAAPAVSIVYDRLIAMLTLLIVTAAVLGIQAAAQADLRWLFERFILLALVAVIGVAVFYGAARVFGRGLLEKIAGEHPIRRFLSRHLASCRLAPDSTPHFLLALAVAIPAHLLNVGAALCIARAVQLDVTFLQCAVAVAFVNFSSVLPVSIGGHGVREAGFVFVFGLYGVLGRDLAHDPVFESVLAFSILFYARSLISSLPGGACYVFFRRQQRDALEAAGSLAVG